MEKDRLDDKLLVSIIAALVALAVIIVVVLVWNKSNQFDKNSSNGYEISDEVVEMPGTNTISNEALDEEKCLDDICVSEVKIYAVGKAGRIECIVKNNTDTVKSGYLKLTASGQTVLIAYKKVEPGQTIKAIAEYNGKSINEADGYTIEKLTKEEIKSIKK